MEELEEIEKYKHLENSIGNVFDEVFLEIIHNQPEKTSEDYENAPDDLDKFIEKYTCEITNIKKFEFIVDQQQNFYIMYKINLSSGKKLFLFHEDVENATRSLSDSHDIHDIKIYLFFIISYYFKTCMTKLNDFITDNHSAQIKKIKQIFQEYESENKIIINILEFVEKIYSELYKIFFEKFEKSNTISGDHNISNISNILNTIELYGTLKLLTYNIIFILCSLQIDDVNDTIEHIKKKFKEAEDKYETDYNNNYELYFNKQFNTIIKKYKKYNIYNFK